MEAIERKALQLRKKEQSSYKMIITEELEKKIRFVCSKISTIEWSGVLFYTHEGEFEDNSLIIKAVDMIVLDIGDGASTTFKCSDPDVITYMVDNDLLDCEMGLIHSHHSMSTFFSGQDQSMLVQEGTDRNIFVSLIVNNAGTYTAGITRKIAAKVTEEICYKTFGNKEICKPVESYDTQYVEWFNLAIIKDIKEENPFPELADRLLGIAERKKQEEEERAKLMNPYGWVTPHSYKEEKPILLEPAAPKNQLNLFNDVKESEPVIPEYKEVTELEDIEFDDELINDMVIKILTGDITANSSTTTKSVAFTNMSLKYSKAFPTDMTDFDYFAEAMIDVLMQTYGNTVIMSGLSDEFFDKYGMDENSIIAAKLTEELVALGNNQYLEGFINTLNNYI